MSRTEHASSVAMFAPAAGFAAFSCFALFNIDSAIVEGLPVPGGQYYSVALGVLGIGLGIFTLNEKELTARDRICGWTGIALGIAMMMLWAAIAVVAGYAHHA
ncbi:MAG: hypothetical protein GC159_21640 [Phycisphaera sp.]|nr:hypothetical protein [Phycisphaera sp.]